MPEYPAIYNDGESAAAHPARARLTARGVRIRMEDGASLLWPYGELTTSGAARAGAPIIIGRVGGEGARLHVEDAEFAADLMRRAPQLSPRRRQWRILKPMLAISAVIAAVSAVLFFTDFSIARILARAVPDAAWEAMGERLSRSMAKEGKFCAAPAGEKALAALAARLNPHDAHGGFRLRVARMGMLNAFTVPGRRIVVSESLLDMTSSPDELAGVIAHEMGHAIERHPETSIVRALGLSAVVTLAAGGGSDAIGQIATLLLQMRYSRRAEWEADDWALRLLRENRVSAEGFSRFFLKLRRKMGDPGSGLIELISTHPATKARIDHIRDVRKNHPWAASPALTKAQWAALKKICDQAP